MRTIQGAPTETARRNWHRNNKREKALSTIAKTRKIDQQNINSSTISGEERYSVEARSIGILPRDVIRLWRTKGSREDR
jgi:hypothetical protein